MLFDNLLLSGQMTNGGGGMCVIGGSASVLTIGLFSFFAVIEGEAGMKVLVAGS